MKVGSCNGLFFPDRSEVGGHVQQGGSVVPLTEREVLLRLYRATGGTEGAWEDDTNWGSASPLEEWYGVFVDESGKVDSLFLTGNGLVGTCPESLGQLTKLTALDLMGNRLTGSIPAKLGALENLEFLDLSRNQLTGPIPAALGDLARLRVLHLNHNQLTGAIPEGLRTLPRLTFLNLAHNQLQVPVSDAWSRVPYLDLQSQETIEDD